MNASNEIIVGLGEHVSLDSPEESLYSEAQMQVLAYVTYFSASLSLLGSMLVIYAILSDTVQLRRSVHYRIMLGLSTLDTLTSLGLLLFGSWAIPKGSNLAYNEQGNIFTCNMAGLSINFLAGSQYYCACLAAYHALLVRFEIRENFIAKWIEPFFHLFSISVPIISGIVFWVKGYFNPLKVKSGFCWLQEYPNGCLDDENVPCTRGEKYTLISRYSIQVSTFLVLVVIITSMVLIIRRVQATESRLTQYGLGANAENMKLTKAAGKRGLLYIGAFFICFIWVSIIGFMSIPLEETSKYRNLYFTVALPAKFFLPLQGFFNAIIFLSTRYEKLTQEGESLHFLSTLTIRRLTHISLQTLSLRGLDFNISQEYPEEVSVTNNHQKGETIPDPEKGNVHS